VEVSRTARALQSPYKSLGRADHRLKESLFRMGATEGEPAGSERSSPEDLDLEGSQEPIVGDESQAFCLRLRNQHPIERIPMMGR